MLEGDAGLNAAQVGRRIVLPTSFPGSPRFMMQAYQDAMAIVRALGIPGVFFTFTCNSNWLEIRSELHEGQTAVDRSDFPDEDEGSSEWFGQVGLVCRGDWQHLDKGIS